MLSKMAGALMSVAPMLGVNSTVPTMIQSADVECFASQVFGVPQKMQAIMLSSFVASSITAQDMTVTMVLAKRRNEHERL